jgi:hypothetical protein
MYNEAFLTVIGAISTINFHDIFQIGRQVVLLTLLIGYLLGWQDEGWGGKVSVMIEDRPFIAG